MMADLLDKDAVEIAALIADGQLSARELMQATLDQIARVNPQVNAIVSLRDGDDLLAEAVAADAGARDGSLYGPLHGLPVAIKDLANVQGLPTSMGSPAFAGQVAQADDLMVARMRAAGAIIIGKTNTPEFGLGSHTFNPVFGPTRNPYDLRLTAGGSSGGAAVALATRMLCIADGSDMMGSLRNPAGWANVYGFRPSWGRVPANPEGDMFLHQLSTSGPMARSVRDIALLLDVQSGPDPRLPLALSAERFSTQLDADVRGRRIGWLGDWSGAFPMEPGVLDTCHAAMTVFADMGCAVEEVAPPFDADLMWESWITLRSWAVAAGLGPLADKPTTRDMLKPEALWEIERGRALSAMAVQRASEIRSDWYRAAAQMFGRYDATVLPTAQVWPFSVEWHWPKSIAGVQMDTYHRWMQVVVPVSLIGLPCLSVPAGFGAAGLPIGMQVFGRRGDDAGLLQLGHAWHGTRHLQARHWIGNKPPMA